MDFNETSEMNFEWRRYVDMMLRHKWLILVPTVLGLVVAIYVAFSLPKIYEAKTVILIESKQLLQPLVEGIAVSTSVKERLASLREEILSWPRLVQLVEQLGLDKDVTSPSAYESLIQGMKNKVSVRMKNDNVINISYQDPVPLHAQNVVRTISDILIERNVASQSEEADDAIEFIEIQLEEYRKKLEESEEQLRQFKEIYTYSLPIAARVNKHIIDLEMKLNMLLVENTDEHPAVIELRKQIVQLKGEREKELMKIESHGVDVDSEEFKAITYSVPRQQQELASLQRDTKVNAKLYEQLLSRLESAKISKTLDSAEEGTRFKVIEPARLPLKPIRPDKPRIIIIGLVLGIGLGCGTALLLEFSNATFRSVEDAKRVLTLPILGAISKIEVNPQLTRELRRRSKTAAKKKKQKEKKEKKRVNEKEELAESLQVKGTDVKVQISKPEKKGIVAAVRGIGRALGIY